MHFHAESIGVSPVVIAHKAAKLLRFFHSQTQHVPTIVISQQRNTAMPMGCEAFHYLQINQFQPMTESVYLMSVRYKLFCLSFKTSSQLCSIILVDCVKREWTKEVAKDVQSFIQRKNELSIENGCLLWGTLVVIPKSLQGILLQSLHESHPRITCMKALAQSYF